MKEADDSLRFVTADGRTTPRHGYRRADFVDDDVGTEASDPSEAGFRTSGSARNRGNLPFPRRPAT